MTPEKPIGLYTLLAAELAVALLFSLFSWSMTKSLAQGRMPSLLDSAALMLPVLLVIGCGIFALRLWRRGKRKDAWGLALLPFPLALVLFMALGAV
jgi:predicted transporter